MNDQFKGRVLVLDDDQAIINLLDATLFLGGWDVIQATSPKEAFKVLALRPIDFLIVDIQLNNKINGFDFVQELRASDHFKKLPVIFVTGQNFSDQDVKKAATLRATGYILKPFKPDSFLRRVRELVG